MGKRSYGELIRSNPNRLRAPAPDLRRRATTPDVCAAARKGYGDLVEFVRAGVRRRRRPRCRHFFARGMLINVVASMDLLDADEPWAKKLLAFCERE